MFTNTDSNQKDELMIHGVMNDIYDDIHELNNETFPSLKEFKIYNTLASIMDHARRLEIAKTDYDLYTAGMFDPGSSEGVRGLKPHHFTAPSFEEFSGLTEMTLGDAVLQGILGHMSDFGLWSDNLGLYFEPVINQPLNYELDMPPVDVGFRITKPVNF